MLPRNRKSLLIAAGLAVGGCSYTPPGAQIAPGSKCGGNGRHQIHPPGVGGPKPHGNCLSFTGTDGNRDFNEPTSRDLF